MRARCKHCAHISSPVCLDRLCCARGCTHGLSPRRSHTCYSSRAFRPPHVPSPPPPSAFHLLVQFKLSSVPIHYLHTFFIPPFQSRPLSRPLYNQKLYSFSPLTASSTRFQPFHHLSQRHLLFLFIYCGGDAPRPGLSRLKFSLTAPAFFLFVSHYGRMRFVRSL